MPCAMVALEALFEGERVKRDSNLKNRDHDKEGTSAVNERSRKAPVMFLPPPKARV